MGKGQNVDSVRHCHQQPKDAQASAQSVFRHSRVTESQRRNAIRLVSARKAGVCRMATPAQLMPVYKYTCVLCNNEIQEFHPARGRQLSGKGVCLTCTHIALVRYGKAGNMLTFDEYWRIWYGQDRSEVSRVCQKSPKEIARVFWTAALVHGVSTSAQSTTDGLKSKRNRSCTGNVQSKRASLQKQQSADTIHRSWCDNVRNTSRPCNCGAVTV